MIVIVPSGLARHEGVDAGEQTETHRGQEFDTDAGRIEVRCPTCRSSIEIAADTSFTDLTCSSCGSHFSLIDQSQETHLAPSIAKMGRFELIERLGLGNFGTVWKARDKELDRTVAIKVPRRGGMTAEEQEKFLREARAAAQLRHDNIVSVHEVGREGDSVFIVSEFIRGVTLGDWLDGQQLNSREAAELCAKIAEALDHAHQKRVIHRDLKPANIMMDGEGEPHVMDFGLARREVGEVTVTVEGQLLGTPAYMSPEQAIGESHSADRRSDVYSLGVILFQMLTGELPFRGNVRMIIHQVINDEPPSPRKLNATVPKDLETITLKCLEKEPDRRYQSAQVLSDELGRYLNGEPILARAVGRFEQVWRWARRKPAVAALCALAISFLLGGGITSTVLWRRAERERLSARHSEMLAQSRLVAEQTARQQTNAEAAKTTAISNLLQQMLESANPDTANGIDYTVREMLNDFSSRLSDQLTGQPLAEASIRATIGNVYRRLGLLGNAEPQLKTALDLRQRILGVNHSDVAQSLHDYALYLMELKNYVEAHNLALKAVAIHRELGLRNSANVELLSNLQLILILQRKYEDAETIAQEALIIAREQSGQNPEVANILHRLADIFNSKGEYAKGEELALESVELHHKLHGANHPETAWGLAGLANSLRGQRRFEEAEQHYREALTIFLEHYDYSHHSVKETSASLEGVLTSKGDQPGLAEFIALKIERIKRTIQRNPADAQSLNELASILATSNASELRDGKWAVELATKACELTDYKYPNIVGTLAAAYAEAEDYDRAVKWSEKALELLNDASEERRSPFARALVTYQARQRLPEESRHEFVSPRVSELRVLTGTEQSIEFRIQNIGGINHRYLNSKIHYQQPDCFTAVVEGPSVKEFDAKFAEPEQALIGKIIRVKGKVEELHGRIQIRVTDIGKQLEIVEKAAMPPSKLSSKDPEDAPGGK